MSVISEKALAVIPARGGSKRIPMKNTRPFCGVPVIAYSIKAAQESGCFSEVMVSTDDEGIAAVARSLGASVPFMRSAANSSDLSSTADVISEVLAGYARQGREFLYCCCLYPTAPFVSADRLKQGLDRLVSTGADSVFPVVRFGYPVWRGLEMNDGRVSMIWPEHSLSRSQDLKPVFHDAGQFYWLRAAGFLREKKLFPEFSVGMEVAESQAQDIDTEEDWKMAELKFNALKGCSGRVAGEMRP